MYFLLCLSGPQGSRCQDKVEVQEICLGSCLGEMGGKGAGIGRESLGTAVQAGTSERAEGRWGGKASQRSAAERRAQLAHSPGGECPRGVLPWAHGTGPITPARLCHWRALPGKQGLGSYVAELTRAAAGGHQWGMHTLAAGLL